ncbi:hypothetical protein CesoFtcFv8_000282 [Champsocephalus esox]|uniref:Uncharacterized protein n=1 Tax=Champsocephalus esox TaxID=159716 RepID=A0AAN8DWK3_9TELE|nr:hypothetical protein CesoFtcFv8_000282 [Champsocephalus esox]
MIAIRSRCTNNPLCPSSCTKSGAQETERLLTEAVEAFKRATDTMNVPLLDQRRMEKILETQRQHIPCIQDPAGVRLYTRTGQLTRGGVSLPVYRCARGSTSLESFHLHLHRFIPGSSARGTFFQMFLLEGLTTGIHALQGRRTEEEALLEAEEPRAEEPRAEEPRAEEPLPGPANVFMELVPSEEDQEPFPATPSSSSSSAPSCSSASYTPKSTNYNRRRLQKEQAEAARRGEGRRLRAPSQNKCSSCGLRKIKETGHRLLLKANGERVGFCPVLAEHKSPEEWLDSLR